MEPKVILVDEQDNEIGSAGKLEAHKNSRLHRAFSIFIFNSAGELLIQQRAMGKYHCSGLWSNTCCSHPQPNQSMDEAIHLRLRVEMGFDTDLEEIDSVIYQAKFDNGLTEFEFDHIYEGKWDGIPPFNKDEVADYKWIMLNDLLEQIDVEPLKFTAWFPIALKKLMERGKV